MKKKIKEQIQAVFLDIDGTYYDHQKDKVLPSTMEAMRKLKERGYKIALCSGRPFRMAQELSIFDGVQWDGFIGSAGNTVYDEQIQLIEKNGFSNAELKQIFSIAKEKNLCLYVNGSSAFLTQKDPEAMRVLEQFHVQIPNEIRDWDPEDVVDMISLFKGYDYDYSDFLQIPTVKTQKSSGCIVDLIKEGVSKVKGIESLLKYWHMEQAPYMAFGDSLNDKEMIQEATIGVAMENSDPDLFAYADFICGPSDQDSIALTLRQFRLID